jgi:hypothetical protein
VLELQYSGGHWANPHNKRGQPAADVAAPHAVVSRCR